MVKKLVGILFAAALLWNTGLHANAAERTGSIRISMEVGELPVTNGSVTIYQVGTPRPDGYLLTDSFGGGIVKAADAESLHLAKWLAESSEDEGKTIYLDVDGNVTFSNLEAGLYLLVQTEQMDGFHKVNPFLLRMPEGDTWEVCADLVPNPIIIDDNPKTGQHPGPLLAAMGLVASGVGLYLCVDSRRRK